MTGPEVPVCPVDVRNVAEQFHTVNVCENIHALQVAQTVQEQLNIYQKLAHFTYKNLYLITVLSFSNT